MDITHFEESHFNLPKGIIYRYWTDYGVNESRWDDRELKIDVSNEPTEIPLFVSASTNFLVCQNGVVSLGQSDKIC